jgi:hypothetical protein
VSILQPSYLRPLLRRFQTGLPDATRTIPLVPPGPAAHPGEHGSLAVVPVWLLPLPRVGTLLSCGGDRGAERAGAGRPRPGSLPLFASGIAVLVSVGGTPI